MLQSGARDPVVPPLLTVGSAAHGNFHIEAIVDWRKCASFTGTFVSIIMTGTVSPGVPVTDKTSVQLLKVNDTPSPCLSTLNDTVTQKAPYEY